MKNKIQNIKGKKSKNKDKPVNILISGIGGQGVLTLAVVMAEAAVSQGYDVTTAEVHGLAMRFGHLEVHLRLGKKINSPLIPDGEADLVIGLEPLEALKAARYIGKDTTVIFDTEKSIPNKMHIQREQYPDTNKVVDMLKKISKTVKTIPASEIAKKLTGSDRQSNIYLLGYLVKSKLISINQQNIMKTLDLLPFPEINKQMFKAGMKK